MKTTPAIILILVVCVGGSGAIFGYGCGQGSGVDRKLEENQEQIERLEAEKDSINALRRQASDSLVVFRRRVERADSARTRAETQTAAAYAAIKRLPTYETLTHDALALRADSLYVALADR